MTATLEHPEIITGSAPISRFKVESQDEKGRVLRMDVDGIKVRPTERFWTSLCSRYSTFGLSPKNFKLFTHEEVFNRLQKTVSDDKSRLRFTIEGNGEDGKGKLLAVTSPTKPMVEINRAAEVIGRHAASNMEYADGIIRSTHMPPHMEGFDLKIKLKDGSRVDSFKHQYILETPIDGYGNPLTYLMLLRLICTNGMIGLSRAFRSEVKLGNTDVDPMFTVERYLDAYNNEEGYSAIQQRFESAAGSWASIAECNSVYRILSKLASNKQFHDGKSDRIGQLAGDRTRQLGGDGASALDGSDLVNLSIMRAYTATTGDLCSIYGLTHLDALSRKKMGRLPAQCSVYDLLNLATEVATHYCTQKNGRPLQAQVGQLISNEYDLQGTMVDNPEFGDFFIETDGKTMAGNS